MTRKNSIENLESEILENRVRVIRLYCGMPTETHQHASKVANTLAGKFGQIIEVSCQDLEGFEAFRASGFIADESKCQENVNVYIVNDIDLVPLKIAENLVSKFENSDLRKSVLIFTSSSVKDVSAHVIRSAYVPRLESLNLEYRLD